MGTTISGNPHINPYKKSEMELFHTTSKWPKINKLATGALFDSIGRDSKIAGPNWIRGEQRVAGAGWNYWNGLWMAENPWVIPGADKKKHDVFFRGRKK